MDDSTDKAAAPSDHKHAAHLSVSAVRKDRMNQEGRGRMTRSEIVFWVVLSQAGAVAFSLAMYAFADTPAWWNMYMLAGPMSFVAVFFTGPRKRSA